MNNYPAPRQSQTGFTMVELIVVIVILGILSAVALPKFTNMQGDARAAKLNAARGAAAAAIAMVHGSAMARQGVAPGVCLATGSTPTTISATTGNGSLCTEEPVLINVTRLYPSANANGIIAAAGIVPTEGYTIVNGNPITVRVTGATAAATCQFTYTAPTALGVAPVLSTPVVTGC